MTPHVNQAEVEDDALDITQKNAESDVRYRSESPGDGFVIPNTVAYTLYATFPGRQIPHSEGNLQTNSPESYQDIKNSARKLVEQNLGEPDDAKVLTFRYGYCIISKRGDSAKRRISLTSRNEWKHICRSLIADYSSGDHRKYDLAIHRGYFELPLRPKDLTPFAHVKRWDFIELMKPNIDEKKYVSRADLQKYTSEQMVRAIVIHDPCWAPTSIGRDDLIQDILQKSARKLLAMCVYTQVSMKCLKKLIELGYRDQKLPRTLDECCEKHRKYPEDMLDHRGIFNAAEFKPPGEYQEIRSRVVVPAIPIDADRNDLKTGNASRTSEGDLDSPATGSRSARNLAMIGEGTHGCVYRVRIDPYHHTLSEASS